MAWFIWLRGGKAWRQTAIAAAGILTLALAGVGAWQVQEQRIRETMAVYKVPTQEKILALTFDLSWGHTTPPPVLDILREYGLKVTFFLSGPWVKVHPEIAQQVAKDGHEVGTHGYRHVNYTGLSSDQIRSEIQKAEQNILEVTGKKPHLIRTPNGDFDARVVKTLEDLGYKVIQWDTDSLDWKNPGVEAIVNRVLKRAHPGDIILMHASDTCKQTAEALPRIIEGLTKEGYRIVTVSELLSLLPKPNEPAPGSL